MLNSKEQKHQSVLRAPMHRAHPDTGISASAQQLSDLGCIILAGCHHQQQVHWG